MAEIYGASGGYSFAATEGDYDPGITDEIDRQIRNMPMVKAYLLGKAKELKAATGSDNFDIVESTDPAQQRPRYYVAPNSAGIKEELTQSVLLKAALGMVGK